jgi:hypothetical protein
LTAHSTHPCVVALQIIAAAGQSAFVLQPTQAPVLVSHVGVARSVHSWSLVHAAWHVCVPGQHDGVVPAPQFAFVTHSTHAPSSQMDAAAGHCESSVQSTHPRTGSHCWPVRHAFVPFGPQMALPPPGPASPARISVDEFPPHARIATAPASSSAIHRDRSDVM